MSLPGAAPSEGAGFQRWRCSLLQDESAASSLPSNQAFIITGDLTDCSNCLVVKSTVFYKKRSDLMK